MQPRILLAEDNLINQRLVQCVLSRVGLQVDIVEDGGAAVRACNAKFYDVVLMDVHMPSMDGEEATRLIRKLPINQPIIIAVTAMALVGDRDRCLQSGMNDYLSKPFTPSQLLDIVQRSFERCAERQQPR